MAILAECPRCHRKQSLRNKNCKCGENLDKAKKGQRVKYWIQYRLPGGKQRKELVGMSIEEARDAEGKRRSQKREGRIFDMLPDSKITFNELAKWFLNLEKVKLLAYYKTLKRNIEKFNAVFGELLTSELKPADLENFQTKLKQSGLSDSYVDQGIKAVQTMVNKAFDNDMVSGEVIKVFRKVKKLLKRNANARNRVLSRNEFDRLMDSISKQPKSQHLKAIVATAYYTGMRRGEIVSLTWNKVDLKNRFIRLKPEDTKDREARNIPICKELLETFLALPNRIQDTDNDNHVFQYAGKSVFDIRNGLKSACKDAGIPYGRNVENGFTLHDLRHTFNTNMRKAGIAESVIMEITGHSTREMFDRYNTVDEDDTRDAIETMESYLDPVYSGKG